MPELIGCCEYKLCITDEFNIILKFYVNISNVYVTCHIAKLASAQYGISFKTFLNTKNIKQKKIILQF